MSEHDGMWAFSGPTIDDLKESLTRLLDDVHFEARYSEARGGDYWGTPNRAVPVLGIYPNVEDEDGFIHLPGHPEVSVLVDAGELDDEQLRLIQSLGGTPIAEYQHEST